MQRSAPVTSRLRVNDSCEYISTSDLMCLASGTRGGHVVLPWAFAPRVGLTTRFSFRRFHYIGPSSHDGATQRAAPVISRLRVNGSCKYTSTCDLMCLASGTRGGHVVLPWAFAPRVGLTTRFSFRRFHYIGPSSHDGLTQRAAPVTSRLRVNDSCKYISTSDLMCLASGTRGGHVVLPWDFAPRVGLTTRFSFRRFHYIGPPSHDGATQRAAPVTSRLRVNDSCEYISTSDLMCLASGTRGGHVVLPWDFAPRVGLTTRFSFRRFHYIGPPSHDGATQRAAPVTSRLRVNDSCKYISTSDLMCLASGTRGGHVVLPWDFAPRVGLTTRFSFRRFHYIGPSSHDGLTQRAAPVTSRLRVNESCKYISTSDLMCLASGTRGGHVALPWAFAPRVGLTTRFSFRRFHYIGPPSHDGATQRAAPVTSRLRVNDSCKYISTSDLMCLASGTRGGHVVLPWDFAPRVGLTTRFSFRRFHYIGPSSHDGLMQRAAPVTSRLRVNDSCKYISTSDLMCLASGTRGGHVALPWAFAPRVGLTTRFSFRRFHYIGPPSHDGATQRAAPVTSRLRVNDSCKYISTSDLMCLASGTRGGHVVLPWDFAPRVGLTTRLSFRRFHYIGPSSHDGLMQRAAPVTSRLRVNDSCKYISTSDLMCLASGTRGGHVALPWAFAPRVGLTTRFSFRRFHYIGPPSHDGATQRAAPVTSRLRVNDSCKYISTSDLMCLASGTRGGHVVLPWDFAPRVGLTTRFSFRRFHYIGPSIHDGLMQRAAPVTSRLRVNDSCEYISTSDLMCLASGTRGGHVVLPWAFAPRVGLTTRFSFRRFHYIGPSRHDGLTQRSAPVTSRLRVNDSCEYISTSDLMCSASGTRGGHVVLQLAFAPRVGLTTRFSFRRFHYIGPSSHDGSTQRAAPVTSRLRVNDSCKHTSTSDLKCLARGARRRTRGVAMGLHVSRRIDDKFFFRFLSVTPQRVDKPRWLNATCKLHRDRVCTVAADMSRPALCRVYHMRLTSADTRCRHESSCATPDLRLLFVCRLWCNVGNAGSASTEQC